MKGNLSLVAHQQVGIILDLYTTLAPSLSLQVEEK